MAFRRAVCVYVLGNIFVSSFRYISWFRCMFFALVHFIIFFFGLYFGFCLHRNFHPSSETKREQNSLFAIQPPSRFWRTWTLCPCHISSLPPSSSTCSLSRELFVYFEAFTFLVSFYLCLSLSVCVPRIVQQSRVFLRFEQNHPPHAINRHRATTTTTIHVHILWKLKLVLYRFVAVRLPVIFPLHPLSIANFYCFFVFRFLFFCHHFTLYRLPKSHCHYYVLWNVRTSRVCMCVA